MFAFFDTTRKAARAVLAIAGIALVAACEPVPNSGGPSIDASKPVQVALLVPGGSGEGGDAILAQSLENAAKLAIADLQNVQIDLRVYQTSGNAQIAASKAAEAVNDGARIILGPVYGESAVAVGQAVKSAGVNVLSFSNNQTVAGGNVYVLGPTVNSAAKRLTSFAARQGKTNALVVHGNDLTGTQGRDAVTASAAASGVTISGVVPYDLSQQGVIDAVPNIRASVQQTNANTVFLTATTAGALPLLTQLLPETGLSRDTTQLIGLTRWDIPSQTLELPGVQGGWFAIPDPATAQLFRSRYEAAYATAPHPIGGLAYDGIAAIGALVATGNAKALTGASLTQSAGFQGVSGVFRLLPDGTNERALAVATIQDRQVTVLDPAPTSFAGF